MAEYLLEIGMEEMPAAYMNGAVSDLKKNAQALFETVRLTYDSLETYATPRRLVLDVKGLADLQEDLSEEVKGPSVKAAYKGRSPSHWKASCAPTVSPKQTSTPRK